MEVRDHNSSKALLYLSVCVCVYVYDRILLIVVDDVIRSEWHFFSFVIFSTNNYSYM